MHVSDNQTMSIRFVDAFEDDGVRAIIDAGATVVFRVKCGDKTLTEATLKVFGPSSYLAA